MDAARLPSDDSLTNSPLRGYSRFTFACHLRFCHLCSESFCRDLGAGLFRTRSVKSAGCSAGISEEGTREHIDENCYLYTPMICVSPYSFQQEYMQPAAAASKERAGCNYSLCLQKKCSKQELRALLSPWRNNDVYARDFKSM